MPSLSRITLFHVFVSFYIQTLFYYFITAQETCENTIMTGSLTATPAWEALAAHFQDIKDVKMDQMFKEDPDRFNKFSLNSEGVLFDFSKNRISDETMKLLYGLAKQQDVSGLAKKMFDGEKISKYERRAVYSMFDNSCNPVNNKNLTI